LSVTGDDTKVETCHDTVITKFVIGNIKNETDTRKKCFRKVLHHDL